MNFNLLHDFNLAELSTWWLLTYLLNYFYDFILAELSKGWLLTYLNFLPNNFNLSFNPLQLSTELIWMMTFNLAELSTGWFLTYVAELYKRWL